MYQLINTPEDNVGNLTEDNVGNNYIVTNWDNKIATKAKQRHVCLNLI